MDGIDRRVGGDASSSYADPLSELDDSIENNEEDDRFWNTSHQEGFNFGEDGPTMMAPQKSVLPKRQQTFDFPQNFDRRPSHKSSAVTPPTGRPTPGESVENIFLGNPYSLEQFRSFGEKEQLLSAAIQIGDTATLQVVILFLRGTLKSSLFQQTLMKEPKALRAYLNYLRENGEGSQLNEQLTLSGLASEIPSHRYRAISKLKDTKALQNALESTLNTTLAGGPYYNYMRDQLTLLELQTKIQEVDEATLNLKESIVGMSLTETVKYCAKHHSKDPDDHFASTVYLKRTLGLSDSQYSHACISGYAEGQNYSAIETFLETKSWLGKKKLSSSIGFDKVVLILYANKAPSEILERYIALVEDVQERLDLAEKVQAYNALVNCYVLLRDREGLLKILGKLPRESTATELAQTSLANPAIKWKQVNH